jgi:hypothetical protein
MALGVKDVIGLIITYIGTKALGAIPLKPTIGVNIQGTPAMAVDLFAVIGGMFPNLSAAIKFSLTSAFDGLAVSLGLDPQNLFMSSPLGTLAKDISSSFTQLSISFNLNLAEQAAYLGAWETSAAALTSAMDQTLGLPSTAWTDYATNLVKFGDPLAVDLISPGAQVLNPGALASNIEGTIANSVEIESCLKPATSTVLLEAAQADFKLLQERFVNAVDATAKDLIKKEFVTKIQDYTKQMDNQLETFNAQAAEIGKKLNASANMSAQVVPPTVNVKTAELLTSKATEMANSAAGAIAGAAAGAAISPAQLAAITSIAQRIDSVVLPVFKEQVLPVIDKQLAMEANTSITATDRLAASSTDIKYSNGYPVGVNLRYDDPIA